MTKNIQNVMNQMINQFTINLIDQSKIIIE